MVSLLQLHISTKRLLQAVVLTIVLATLTACTSGDQTQTEQITLQWWGVFLDENVVASVIKEYEDLNPTVKIDYANNWPGGRSELAGKLYQDELDRILRENNTIAIPDIFMVENTWVGNYEKYTQPAPTSVIDPQTVKTDYYPAVAKNFVNQDIVRGLPLWMDTLAVLYNKNMLASLSVSTPPQNWVDFKALATNLTQRSGGTITRAGFAAGLGSNISFGPELLNLLFLQNQVGITDANGSPAFSKDPDGLTALTFYKDFAAGGGSWNSSFQNDALAFLEGKAAMIVAPSWRYRDILTFNEKYNLGINIGVASLPQIANQNPPVINWATYWGNMVAKNRPNTTEAWKFLNWLSQPDQLRKLNSNLKLNNDYFGILYPRTDMQQDLQADQYLRVYNAALPTAETWYMIEGRSVKEEFVKLLDQSGASQSNLSATESQIQSIVSNKGTL